jgi:hypothetical protein
MGGGLSQFVLLLYSFCHCCCSGLAMNATRFIYVAKHGCGFLAYNSSVDYPYSATHSSAPNADVVSRFVASAKKAGVGFGF